MDFYSTVNVNAWSKAQKHVFPPFFLTLTLRDVVPCSITFFSFQILLIQTRISFRRCGHTTIMMNFKVYNRE